jgi:uncharacterized iron-regulated protein
MKRLLLPVLVPCLVASQACAVETVAPKEEPKPTIEAPKGKTFTSSADAPSYDGNSFTGMQIFDLERGVYLDNVALLEALDKVKLVFFGEQHETAPVQGLELWFLEQATQRWNDVSLAMEHFQRDEQGVIDDYFADKISTAEFESKAQVWPNYGKFWRPIVEHAKAQGRPLVALNVPKEALSEIYGRGTQVSPLTVFNAFPASHRYNASLPPRPLPAWDETFKAYFKSNFDYESHAKGLGLSYEDGLTYFTDLAHIRDETMAYWVSEEVNKGGHVVTMAGDWHVQTGIATPDRAARYATGQPVALITTSPKAKLDALMKSEVSGRKVARFFLAY